MDAIEILVSFVARADSTEHERQQALAALEVVESELERLDMIRTCVRHPRSEPPPRTQLRLVEVDRG